MPTIKQLRQRNPESQHEHTQLLCALYEGGDKFQRHIETFLKKRPSEDPTQYELRKSEAVYRNYLGPIIDYFTALLFSSSPRAIAVNERGEATETDQFYAAFHDDCDRNGKDLPELAKEALRDAMIEGRSWIWLQQPSAEERPTTLAEFVELGLGDIWATALNSDDVLDWETDETGALEWVLLHSISCKRQGLDRERDRITETWTHILSDRVDTYAITYDSKNKPPEQTDVPLVETALHSFGTVPVVCLDLPDSLWVANRIESPQLAHFRLTNMQFWGMGRSCYAMPIFKVDSEENEEPQMGAGYGIRIGLKESIEWAAPPTSCFESLASEIRSHKDEIYRIAQTMALGVENNAAAVGRSADSKVEDARATSVVMGAFAKLIKEKIEQLYDLVSRARSDNLTWSVEGLDDYAANDVAGVIEMLDQVESSGGIPSKTFQVEMRSRIAESLMPDLDKATRDKIRKEIDAGVDDQSSASRAAREQQRLKAIRTGLDQEKPDDAVSKEPAAA